MATQVGYGPLLGVLGPPPTKPFATLLDAARIVPEADEHWMNGVKVYPYPPGPAHVHDGCQSGTSRVKAGAVVVPLPEFGGFTVYLSDGCSSIGVVGGGISAEQAQERFIARAKAAFTAIEAAAVEKEFMSGSALGLNPHLADGTGNFPIGNTAVSALEAIAILEDEIAVSGRQGIIHMTPSMLTKASGSFLVSKVADGELRTINGTRIVPGYGYVGSTQPSGKSAPAGGDQAWMYATGPIDIRRSEVFVNPENVAGALDRVSNSLLFQVERHYVVDWDTVVHSAVLADRSA